MIIKPGVFFFLLALFFSFTVAAVEYTDGNIRLVLDEKTGRFSLYSLQGTQGKDMALFADQDPRTSFLSVIVNDRSYKMGDTSTFRIHLGGNDLNPSIIFESSFLIVTQEFSFTRRANSTVTNGVSVTITLENRGNRQMTAGARFLLDTYLGEAASDFFFTTNLRTINSEILLTRTDDDNWWTDKNEKASLTGSLKTGAPEDPDSVHFANWKKLSDVSWKAPVQPGRNFNYPPYSVEDSAVCYYYEPRPISRGEKRSFVFYLFLNDESGFGSPNIASGNEVILDMPKLSATGSSNLPDAGEQDLVELHKLMSRIDNYIISGNATEEELTAIEFALNRLRAKYGSDFNFR